VITFATHEKRTRGWLLPTDDYLARDKMLRLVGQSVEDVLRRACWGMPGEESDSLSPSFGDQQVLSPKMKWTPKV